MKISWEKELINGKWFSIADVEHVPLIEHCNDGTFRLRNLKGNSIIHKSFNDAAKLAIDIYRKYKWLSKFFVKSNIGAV